VPANRAVFLYISSLNVDCVGDSVTISINSLQVTQKICSTSPKGYKVSETASGYNLTLLFKSNGQSPFPSFEIYVFLAQQPATTTTTSTTTITSTTTTSKFN
jgi:hypothetical protein